MIKLINRVAFIYHRNRTLKTTSKHIVKVMDCMMLRIHNEVNSFKLKDFSEGLFSTELSS